MSRLLVVGHKTLGGQHLVDHLARLRASDPTLRVHVVVPEYHPLGQAWTHVEIQIQARSALTGVEATGEVGDASPVVAVGQVIDREGAGAFDGIVLSTLPEGISRWWHLDVPKRIKAAHPDLSLTHLVADYPRASDGP